MEEKKHGGKRAGAGRPSKAEETKLIERLDSLIESDEVIQQLHSLIAKGNFRAIQLYFQYRWGKPKEQIDVTTNGESLQPNQITFIKSDGDKD